MADKSTNFDMFNLAKSLGFKDDEIFTHSEFLHKSVDKPVVNDSKPGNNLNAQSEADQEVFEIIEPVYDLRRLKLMYDLSDSLRTAIEAYETNISGFGYEFVPELDIITNDGKKVYRDSKEPVPEQVLKEINDEYADITMFFESICLDRSWVEINTLETKLKEIYGNAFLEIERDADGDIINVDIVESHSIKLTPREPYPGYEFDQMVKNPNTLEYEVRPRYKRFRRFIQELNNGNKIYFKEFGDPRIINALDGKEFKGKKKDIPDNFREATEIKHYKIEDPGNLDGYGVPRWVSLIPVLLGVRGGDLLNWNLMKNKGIPDFILICEGASAEEIVSQIKDGIKNNKIKGEFGNMLVVAGDTQRTGGVGPGADYQKPSIRVEPLSQLLTKEGMFTGYQKAASERVAAIFRLPNIFIGKNNEINRSVAEVSKQMTEEQVFMPLRIKKDDDINRTILRDKKIRYWKHKSKSSKLENTEAKAKITDSFLSRGVITPKEGRIIAGELLDKDFEEINEDWVNKPLVFSLRNNQKPSETKTETVKSLKLDLSDDSEVANNLKTLIEKQYQVKVKEMMLVGE